MRKFVVLFVIVFFFIGAVYASLPETKTYKNQNDLLNGRLQGISITSEGELLLAPELKPIFDSARPFIWDAVSDKNGNLYLATGDGAKIFQVDPSGKGQIIAEWQAAEVYSLSIDNNGVLYAGSSPDGKIYRFDRNNRPQVFVDLDVKYIWDILFDRQNVCYVATGDSGKIFQVDQQGKSSIFYESSETHIRSLAWDRDSQLLAGSFNNGYLYRFNRKKEAFVIYDAEFQEIHQICVAANGTIYAAVLGQEETALPSFKIEKEKTSSSKPSIDDEIIITSSSISAEKPKTFASGIIKIQPDGVIKNIWNMEQDQVQSIFIDPNNTLLVGASNNGRLFKILPNDEKTYLHKFDESQVVAFVPGKPDATWIATSNLGKIYAMESRFAQVGEYESEVVDAKTNTQWGMINWEQNLAPGTTIKLFSRSGNTQKPNSTWSPWSAPYEKNGGEYITSPKARFLQWKLVFTTNRSAGSPMMKNLKISYLQQNLPPEIFSINVSPVKSSGAFQQPAYQEPSVQIMIEDDLDSRQPRPSAQTGAGRPLQDGYLRARWSVKDPNNDQLLFDLYFQRQGENTWWLLKEDIARSIFTWDSHTMPDGIYQLKVIASDEKSNPLNAMRQAEKISDVFVVDNTAPAIENATIKIITPGSLLISFRVVDKMSLIKQVEFSYDIQSWFWVQPVDLVCDSKQEDFQFKIKFDTKKFRSIIVKATDEADNFGYGSITIKE
ncbi:hypothetical protein L0Z72_01545 [candidate division KSB1 bacterium]|nr:hypothetical protein [candidate division KSB1 bacterium]